MRCERCRALMLPGQLVVLAALASYAILWLTGADCD